MGTIIGMIEPNKVAFSIEMTGINGIFRKPCIPGTTSLKKRGLHTSSMLAKRIAKVAIQAA